MSNDYLPSKENDLKTFGLNFAAPIKAEPANYGLTAGDATQIDDAAQDYATKYGVATNKATRTEASINDKDNAKEVLIAILRGYGKQIKANQSIAEAAKINLGLKVGEASRGRVPAPQTHPILTVVALGVRQHELKVVDETTPDSRLKPAGVVGVQLFCRIGDAAPATPLSSDFMTLLTRSGMTVDFKKEDVGKTAYYFGRWQTAAGRVGPWGLMVSRTIAE